jgi:type IV pilus assembly protein PilW
MPLMTQRLPVRSYAAQAGFSLVEILVGLIISLLVTLAIMQVFSVFEGQKRSTMGTADAQTNGNIALYNVQRDVQLAGFGLPVFAKTNSPLFCTDFTPVGASISPVVITDGGAAAGASDSITVRYGSTPSGGIPVPISTATVTTAPAMSVGVLNNMGCQVNDTAIIVNGASCVITNVTGPTDIAVPPVPTGPDTTHIELQDGTGVVATASISCMGAWSAHTYAVNNNQLERDGAANVAEIVNMQAQYGISAAGNNNQVTEWVNATGATWGPAITTANRNRIKAVRIAIVARNGLLEKEDVTTACSSTVDAEPTGLCAWDATSVNPATASPAPEIDLSKNTDGTDNPDWQKYRYKVYETIVPIRSMIWAREAL